MREEAAVRLVVEVPFTSTDLPAIKRAREIWSLLPPCRLQQAASRKGLLYVYNHRCSDGEGPCEQVRRIGRTAMTSCGGSVRVHVYGAGLTVRQDRYDKTRRHASWSAGPNHMFHFAVLKAQALGYTHMLQLEADALPIRAGWLQQAERIAHVSDAWIVGSALYANCTREEATGKCVRSLPEGIAEHINGNALYHVASPDFTSYLHGSSHGRTGKMPFDLALHVYRQSFDQPQRRQLLHRFQHSSFIVNMGTSVPDVAALRENSPSTFLVHSSSFAHLHQSTLSYLFFGKINELSIGNSSASSTAGKSRELELASLLNAAGSRREVVAAFVAGALYHGLCENYAHHIRLANVRNHILISLEKATTKWLQERAFAPVLDASSLVSLPEAGSDRFGSSAFFAINGARYRVLQVVLNAGVSMFVLDLDVVVLRDPLQWLTERSTSSIASFDLLLQSDARDGVGQEENDPDLVKKRLNLHDKASWTYVNGGVFFCRATPRSIALFSDVWKAFSDASTAPNEQDLLNKQLAHDRSIRWGILPPKDFPNGFVYFTRPVPGMARPVLIHINWIGGIAEKVFHLAEAGLWLPRTPGDRQYLSIGSWMDKGPDGAMGIAAHRRSLRDGLAIANALNRTLVLPRLPVSRLQSSLYRTATATIAYAFDYNTLVRYFPNVCASDQVAHVPGSQTAKVHVDIGRLDDPPAAEGYTTVRAKSKSGLTDGVLRKRLAKFATVKLLHLSAAYRRATLSGNSMELLHGEQSHRHRTMLRGIQPAARLRTAVKFVRDALKSSLEGFDCVDASGSNEFAGLLHDSGSKTALARSSDILRAAARSLKSEPRRQVLILNTDGRKSSSLYALASSLFEGHVLQLDDIVPTWYRVDYDTADSVETMAREYIELLVCAHAERFIGNLAAPSTHAVCSLSGRKAVSLAGEASKPCNDAFGRALDFKKWHFF